MENFAPDTHVIASPSTALGINSTKQSVRGSASFSDEKLFALCRKYGAEARFWRQKFMGLLPEVNRRELWKKKGFGSIFEFAAKLGGISHKQVLLVLNLDRRFSDMPVLQQSLQNGEISANKLTRIASTATVETQEFWMEQAKILPQSALETFVRDAQSEDQNGLQKPIFEAKHLRAQMLAGELGLSTEVIEKLSDLKRKGIDINEMILEMLCEREKRIEQKKDEISEKINAKAAEQKRAAASAWEGRVPTKAQKRLHEAEFPLDRLVEASRYIAVEIRRVLKEEYGTKCAVPTCEKPSQQIHHANRFALSQNHDPHFLAPLCREHHLIAHSIDVKFHEKRMAAMK